MLARKFFLHRVNLTPDLLPLLVEADCLADLTCYLLINLWQAACQYHSKVDNIITSYKA